MFLEFDEYLKAFEAENYAVDYWYDEGFSIAQEMLEKFLGEDWIQLKNSLLSRSIGWKRRLAYCLHDNNLHELEILLELVKTDDEELFELTVDSLRGFDTVEAKQLILNQTGIINKIEQMISSSGVVTKKVLEDFLINMKS